MSKYRFNKDERYAVWKTLGPLCQWCKEPVEYKDCNIDHILPESLLNDPEKLKEVLAKYALTDDYDINSFENWIPTHPSCNQSKSETVLSGVPIIQQLLEHVRSNLEGTKALYTRWKNQNHTSKIESLIDKGFSDGSITKEMVTEIFYRIDDSLSPVIGMTASTINNNVIYIPSTDHWNVISTDEEFYTVEKGGKQGILPISKTPDPDWLCTNCKHYGPWDGNTCLHCNVTTFD